MDVTLLGYSSYEIADDKTGEMRRTCALHVQGQQPSTDGAGYTAIDFRVPMDVAKAVYRDLKMIDEWPVQVRLTLVHKTIRDKRGSLQPVSMVSAVEVL